MACLTCLGAVAAIQPPLMEICHIIQPARPPNHTSVSRDTEHLNVDSGISSGSQSNSSPNTETGIVEEGRNNSSPGVLTPIGPPSGIQTPVYTDTSLSAHAQSVSWLVKLCVRNVLPHSSENGEHTEPLPVRLESLQVLAHLAKGYFPIIRFDMSSMFCLVSSLTILHRFSVHVYVTDCTLIELRKIKKISLHLPNFCFIL